MSKPKIDIESLTRLEQRVRREFEFIEHPSLDWMPQTYGPDGARALDVLIVGAGQGGTTLAFRLARDRVHEVLVIDKAVAGKEGPWRTYARMPTLRSPKDYTGPDLDVPSLTYRAWHEACFGEQSWLALNFIEVDCWAEYLLWVRKQTGIRVQSETELLEISPIVSVDRTLLAARLRESTGERTLYCRALVLASGQDGAGRWVMPDMVQTLPAAFYAHAADEIDFPSLRGKTVAVLGAGASAADNAAQALEYGAREVHMFVRRPKMQRVQPYRWLSFRGFFRHLCDLDDVWRWRFMQRILSMRESIPQATYDRMRRWRNFEIHVDATWHDVRLAGNQGVEQIHIDTTKGRFQADYIIAGTGIDIDFACRPELAPFAHQILTWADAYTPPPAEEDRRLGRYPYLSADGHYLEKQSGDAPFLRCIYDFTIAATMSFGPSGASINAMSTAVPRLAASITRQFFCEDTEHHWQQFLDYDTPVFVPSTIDENK
jgi:cation diffusion facilitator CzcD-associated flavoprotein CzcO